MLRAADPVRQAAKPEVQSEVRLVPARPAVAAPDEPPTAAAGQHVPGILLQRVAQQVGPVPLGAEFGRPEGPEPDASVPALEPREAR